MKDKVKRIITEFYYGAQNPKRILRTIDENLYRLLDKSEEITWRIRNAIIPEYDLLWQTRSKLKRMKERIEEQSSDEDLDLELFLLKYGGDEND